MKINDWLTLLEEDPVQKKWYLVIQGNPPTIEQYKRNPSQYCTLPHGLYRIEIDLGNTWITDNGICVAKNYGMKIAMNSRQVLTHQIAGNIWIDGNSIIAIGRFKKQGQVIFFEPGGK